MTAALKSIKFAHEEQVNVYFGAKTDQLNFNPVTGWEAESGSQRANDQIRIVRHHPFLFLFDVPSLLLS
jgi:hypothetical protein